MGSTGQWEYQTVLVVAGNKEAHWEGEPTPAAAPPAGSPYEAAQRHRRFQIYVHSKMMIVDDEVGLSHQHSPPAPPSPTPLSFPPTHVSPPFHIALLFLPVSSALLLVLLNDPGAQERAYRGLTHC